jgi:hypothetical protein
VDTKEKGEYELKVDCSNDLSDWALANQSLTLVQEGGAATIGIIIGIVACLCITGGCIWYHKCHKKKDEAFNSDDLYEAFVNNDQA